MKKIYHSSLFSDKSREASYANVMVSKRIYRVPTKDNFAGIDSFSRFIVEDVPRHLENVFGIRAGKTLLAGHSWGGAFALYMMASAQSTFDGYGRVGLVQIAAAEPVSAS